MYIYNNKFHYAILYILKKHFIMKKNKKNFNLKYLIKNNSIKKNKN